MMHNSITEPSVVMLPLMMADLLSIPLPLCHNQNNSVRIWHKICPSSDSLVISTGF
jgi:hypothetical protein